MTYTTVVFLYAWPSDTDVDGLTVVSVSVSSLDLYADGTGVTGTLRSSTIGVLLSSPSPPRSKSVSSSLLTVPFGLSLEAVQQQAYIIYEYRI